MLRLSAAILALLAATATAKKSGYEKSEGVFILTDGNYDKAVAEFEYLLVYYYAPWCGHCKALGPEFVKAGQMLKERDSPVRLGKVDGTEEAALLDRQGVTGYPTLKLYRQGQLVPYTGGRMAPEIVKWLEKKIGPPARQLPSLAEVKSFVQDHEVAVVGFFSDVGQPDYDKYNQACLDYDDYGVHYPVAVTTDKEAAQKFNVENKIVLFKKFDEKKVVYEGELDTQQIRDFITENSLPVVIEFNHENAQKMFKRPNNGKSHLLVFHNKSEPRYAEEMALLARVGREFKETVLFSSVDVEEEDHRRMVEFLGVRHRINNDTYPTMRIVTMKDDSPPVRYRPADTAVTEDNVRHFVTEYVAGNVAKDYFTEPLPADWDSKPAKYLTAANFRAEVMEPEPARPSLVMWFAPWCGHCKNIMPGQLLISCFCVLSSHLSCICRKIFASVKLYIMIPVWEELAEKFPDYLVGKIDATVNEVPGLPAVHSFPTIQLRRVDGSMAEYNGERTVEGLTKFIKTDGVYGLAAPDPSTPPQPQKKDEL